MEINGFEIRKLSHAKTIQNLYENKGETETAKSETSRRSKRLIKPTENQ